MVLSYIDRSRGVAKPFAYTYYFFKDEEIRMAMLSKFYADFIIVTVLDMVPIWECHSCK